MSRGNRTKSIQPSGIIHIRHWSINAPKKQDSIQADLEIERIIETQRATSEEMAGTPKLDSEKRLQLQSRHKGKILDTNGGKNGRTNFAKKNNDFTGR